MFVDRAHEDVPIDLCPLTTPERWGEKYPSPFSPGPRLRWVANFRYSIVVDCLHSITWFQLVKLQGSIIVQHSIEDRSTEAMTCRRPKEWMSIKGRCCDEEEEKKSCCRHCCQCCSTSFIRFSLIVVILSRRR